MPKSLSIMIKPVSSACNMRCKYCFYSDVVQHRQQESMGRMSPETLENLVRRAMRCAEESFAFQGGEPSLAGAAFYRRFGELVRRYNTKGLRVQNAIQTNGYDLSDELLDELKKGGFLVGVSFDGTPAIHDRMRLDQEGAGSSGRVLESIEKLRAREIDFNILCVVNRYVAREPDAVFDSLSPWGYIQYIACIDPFDGARSDYSLDAEDYAFFLKKSFDRYYEAFRAGRFVSVRNFDNYIGILAGRQPENCGMSGRCAQYYLAEADGGLYPCDFYVLDQWRLGNINEMSFFKAEKSPVAEAFRRASLYVSEACRACRWYGLCRGGCRRDREPFLDGLPALNKWCGAYKALFAYAYPRMREMAEWVARGGSLAGTITK